MGDTALMSEDCERWILAGVDGLMRRVAWWRRDRTDGMFGRKRYRWRIRTVLIAGIASCPQAALAQSVSPSAVNLQGEALSRIQAVEEAIDQRQTELDGFRAELLQLRRQLAPEERAEAPSVTPSASAHTGICRMHDASDMNAAFNHPGNLSQCFSGSLTNRSVAAAELAAMTAQPLPDRPRVVPGVSSTLEFSNRSRASLTLSHPVILRSRIFLERSPLDRNDDGFLGFRPQLLTLSGSVNVPTVKGVSNFLSITERRGRSDVDVLPGTTVRLAIDFLNFHRIDRERSFRRAAAVLWRARTACLLSPSTPGRGRSESEFYAQYGLRPASGANQSTSVAPVSATTGDPCIGENLVNYVLQTESDGAGGSRLKRAALASEYLAAFWEEPSTAIPQFGFGGSVEYGTSDFRFRQGALDIVPDPNDASRAVLSLDRSSPLAAEQTVTEDDWKIQAYGAIFFDTLDQDSAPAQRPYMHGIMVIGSVSYLSSHEFRSGASDLTICPLAQEGEVSVRCALLNVDRPYRRDGVNVSAELRAQINNIPVLGVLGFGPRYSRRLSDARQTFDIPVYLSANERGLGSAGIRLRRSWDGEDLLGNRERSATEFSVFLNTPINFRGF